MSSGQRDPDLVVTIPPSGRGVPKPRRLTPRPLRVYVCGPFSGEVVANVARAIDVAERLRVAGHYPFVPHLFVAWGERHPSPYEEWMRHCFAWLAQCDALVRFASSPGADREWEHAGALCLARFEGVDEFLAVHGAAR